MNLVSDPNNCGLCAFVCEEDQSCVNAECVGGDGEGGAGGDGSGGEAGSGASSAGGAAGQAGTAGVGAAGGNGGGAGVAGASGTAGVGGSSGGTAGAAGSGGASGAAGNAGSSGSGGVAGAGGASGASGSSGSSGNAGASGASGAGGTSGTAGNAGSSGSGGSAEPSNEPVVLILMDRSSSMFPVTGERPWDLAYSALTDASDGALTLYEDQIRFGLATFRGAPLQSVPESDNACAEMTSVSIAVENRDAMNEELAELMAAGNSGQAKWETPTGHAIGRAVAELAAYDAGSAVQKYLLLLTDGEPNTCRTADPQCGQDRSIKAIQDAYATYGIRTLALGIGEIVAGTGTCLPDTYHCGAAHLQDLANAGVGFGVAAQPASYPYTACVWSEDGLHATYGTPGSADYYEGETRAEIRASLVLMLSRILAGTVP